ncbi:MAG TPA: acetolactate synthase small subunit [Polyangiales bacterium]|nr:acetolactate synthase small subunit [Polyangiales bacterium]
MIVPAHALHTFSIVTKDLPGVLVRIALVFARRGYNIESLAVSPGSKPGFSRMTITSRGSTQNVEQIKKQLQKLIDVVYVTDHDDAAPVEAEIALIKIRSSGDSRAQLLHIAENFETQIVNQDDETVVLRLTGSSNELDDCIGALQPYGIEELTRSGKIVMDPGVSHFSHLLSANGIAS